VVITPVAKEVSPILSEFVAETGLSAARPAISHASTRRPWIAVAIASLLAFAAFAGGGLWFLRAQMVDSDAIAALLPPPPPRPFVENGVTSRIRDDAPVTDPAPVDFTESAASAVSGESKDYVIQVASFESRARAERLVEELTNAGYRAREVELDLGPPRGRLLQVIVGGYSSALEVERDLQRIRELPGYSDARLLDR
jgi:hypothetical protein